MGYTESMLGFNQIHFHYYFGVCCHNGHSHYFSGISGLPVKKEFGHIHKMDGFLELNNLHEHKFSSYTFEEIEYINGRWIFSSRKWAIN
jgi:hypothetical protein